MPRLEALGVAAGGVAAVVPAVYPRAAPLATLAASVVGGALLLYGFVSWRRSLGVDSGAVTAAATVLLVFLALCIVGGIARSPYTPSPAAIPYSVALFALPILGAAAAAAVATGALAAVLLAAMIVAPRVPLLVEHLGAYNVLALLYWASLVAALYALRGRGPLTTTLYALLACVAPLYIAPFSPRGFHELFALAAIAVNSWVAAEAALGHPLLRFEAARARRGAARALLAVAAALVVLLMRLGVLVLLVVSGSMRPALNPGDIVVVAPVGRPEPGDIVAFVMPGTRMVVVHRVVKLVEKGAQLFVETKGDANPAPDGLIPASSIIGKVVARIPYLGIPLLEAARVLGSVHAAAALFAAPLLLAALLRRRR